MVIGYWSRQVAKFVVENDDSWIPESFKQGIADAEGGCC